MRFIEYMDVGNSNNWTSEKLVSKKEIIAIIAARYLLREIGRQQGSAPSVDYEFVDGAGDIGVIASVTEPFCSTCTRARLTADGKFVTCLFSQVGHDVKSLLRDGASDDDLGNFIRSIWLRRADRYSEERLQAMRSSAYDPKKNKKIEMIALGGYRVGGFARDRAGRLEKFAGSSYSSERSRKHNWIMRWLAFSERKNPAASSAGHPSYAPPCHAHAIVQRWLAALRHVRRAVLRLRISFCHPWPLP